MLTLVFPGSLSLSYIPSHLTSGSLRGLGSLVLTNLFVREALLKDLLHPTPLPKTSYLYSSTQHHPFRSRLTPHVPSHTHTNPQALLSLVLTFSDLLLDVTPPIRLQHISSVPALPGSPSHLGRLRKTFVLKRKVLTKLKHH